MSYSILPTQRFAKEIKRLAKKHPSIKNEYASLIDDIMKDPKTGTFISNNCYKIRMGIAFKGKGKRGGARAITYLYVQTETVYLLTIYDKSEKEDLKPNELLEMIKSLGLE